MGEFMTQEQRVEHLCGKLVEQLAEGQTESLFDSLVALARLTVNDLGASPICRAKALECIQLHDAINERLDQLIDELEEAEAL